MHTLDIRTLASRVQRVLVPVALSFALSACGGGGSSAGDPGFAGSGGTEASAPAGRPVAGAGVTGTGSIAGGGSTTPSSYVSSEPPANARDNVVTIKEVDGATTIDYPVQIGRVFLRGEIANYPQALVDGKGVQTQADVKTRWADGSVRHAILSFYIPTLQAGTTHQVTFANQATAPSGELTVAQMLAPEFNFDSVVRISSGSQEVSASARRMLDEGKLTRWLSGPVSTSIILADHSSSRSYDLGFDSHRSLRPVFHATFWPRIKKVFVRVIGETSNPDAWQTMAYDLTVTGGSSSTATVYSKASVSQHPASRWTRTFWIGDAPSRVDINHNPRYLAATGAIPNFDTRIVVSEKALQNWQARWASAPKGVLEAGNWEKYMSTGGGRPDIGIYPTWVVLWLYTGDHRLASVALGNADLAGAWPFHFRESKPGRNFVPDKAESSQGRPFSVFSRPTFMLSQGNVNIRQAEIRPEDRIQFIGSEGKYSGWNGDGAHQPDPYSIAYMLTGQYWYLEQLQFWASWGTFHNVAGPTLDYSRGPQNTSGGLAGEDRAQAWVFKNRVEAASLSVDNSPEKAYFERQTGDAIAIWEGKHNITDGKFASSAEWAWGLWSTTSDRTAFGVSPLGFWSPGLGGYAGESYLQPGAAKRALATWQNGFVIIALGRAHELGYPTQALLKWAAPFYNQITEGGEARFAYLGAYTVPSVLSSTGRLATAWSESLGGFNPAFDALANFRERLGDLDHGYSNIACAASTYVAGFPGGAPSQHFCQQEQANAPLSMNPKWALLAR